MSQLPILRILPLFILPISLVAIAAEAPPVPMTLGQSYSGLLVVSPTNPTGEVCYGLSVEPNTRINIKVKTGGIGIVKFALYDKSKGLRFFHNDVSNKPLPDGSIPSDSRFSFPAVSEVSQLCLTTSNPSSGQQYDFTVTGKSGSRSKSRLVLRPVAINTPKLPSSQPKPMTSTLIAGTPTVNVPPAPPAPTTAPAPKPATSAVPIPPAPVGEPYCYVGTWQIADLSGYWLPTIQTFTQAKVGDPQMLGYGKITIDKNGNASFEAVDLEQRYFLKNKETGARIDRVSLSLSGSSSARFQVNSDSTLTFSSQNYQRLNAKLNLGANLKLTGDRLFLPFGDRDLPPAKLAYRCVDRDNITLKIPLLTGQKSISIALKRIRD
jgi:hypothetical protein